MKRHLGPIAAVLLVLAGCSSAPAGGSATPDPTIAFCSSLVAYTKTFRDFDALEPSATVEQYKSAGGGRQGRDRAGGRPAQRDVRHPAEPVVTPGTIASGLR